MVDLAAILVIVLSAVRGFLRGALLSLFTLVALVGAFVASAPVGPPVARFLMAREGWSGGLSYVLGRVIAGICIYVPLAILAHVADRKIGRTKKGELRPWNRNLGLIGGIASGLIVVLVLLFVVDLALKVYPAKTGLVVQSARRSLLRRVASAFNPADRFLVTDGLRVLRAAQNDPQVLERLREDPEIRQLLEHPDLQPLLADQKLAQALRQYDLEAVLANQNVRKALANGELRAQMTSPRVRAALHNVMQQRGQVSPGVPSE
ncbi:MAG: hypothetical protein AMK73_01350 [Planctomycetes bacterium SM23_32]|nr:MAG: hypothetical protein AMK73_01350 [Planctomycetes bacterium SM23_32]